MENNSAGEKDKKEGKDKLKKVWNEQNRLKTTLKKVFQPAFGCAQHPKAGQNTQQLSISTLCKAY